MSKKVVSKYLGKLYVINDDELQEWLSEQVLPDLTYVELNEMALIEDSVNKTQFLLGDFPGTSSAYGFTIKIFIYNKDHRALGSLKYVVDASVPESKINAHFVKTADGLTIHGHFTRVDRDGKECFLLTIAESSGSNN
ncbi:hypothetical protein [Flavitalea sp.]|nr:hypothetical protein [Flavitalea sp.]